MLLASYFSKKFAGKIGAALTTAHATFYKPMVEVHMPLYKTGGVQCFCLPFQLYGEHAIYIVAYIAYSLATKYIK